MAILAAADLFSGLQDAMLPYMDRGGASSPANSLLAQLLLKGGSNDKRFVIDEVQRALDIMTQHINAAKLMEMLLPYAAHKGPKVRRLSYTAHFSVECEDNRQPCCYPSRFVLLSGFMPALRFSVLCYIYVSLLPKGQCLRGKLPTICKSTGAYRHSTKELFPGICSAAP
jgi:hypothetical protein